MSQTYTVTIRGHDYEAEGFIEPRDESVGIMSESFVLERLKPLSDNVTQEEADRLCDELCSFESGSEVMEDYLNMEAQVLESFEEDLY